MYRSVTRQPDLRVVLVMGLLLGLSLLLLLSACGSGSQENNKSESGGTASTNGQIVFRRWFDPDQTKAAIFTMNPDGSHISQITHPPKGWRDDLPAWSPDGTKVAFMRQRINEYMQRIMVVNPDTGDTREVTHCGPDQGPSGEKAGSKSPKWTKEHPPPSSGHYCVGDYDPAFSPDGHSIAFSRHLGPDKECCGFTGIFIVGLDGSDPHQVTNVDPKLPNAEFGDLDPAFSPDGKTLVFDRVRHNKKVPKLVKLGEEEPFYHAIFVQSLDSSGSPEDAHQITPWKLNCQDHPEFSPDGKLVLFRCAPKGDEGEGPGNLYWVHPDGTHLHALTHEDADKQYLRSTFSPSFSGGEGWISAGRTGGYGDEGNADVFRVLIKDGEVVRSVNLTKSAIWDSAAFWGTHPPVD